LPILVVEKLKVFVGLRTIVLPRVLDRDKSEISAVASKPECSFIDTIYFTVLYSSTDSCNLGNNCSKINSEAVWYFNFKVYYRNLPQLIESKGIVRERTVATVR
jgi:hypothetical protein